MTELEARIAINPPRTQEACCRLAAELSIATLGPVHTERDIQLAAIGIAQGLFGEAYEAANGEQKERWVRMCEEAYRYQLDQRRSDQCVLPATDS